MICAAESDFKSLPLEQSNRDTADNDHFIVSRDDLRCLSSNRTSQLSFKIGPNNGITAGFGSGDADHFDRHFAWSRRYVAIVKRVVHTLINLGPTQILKKLAVSFPASGHLTRCVR